VYFNYQATTLNWIAAIAINFVEPQSSGIR
jgi:hypothetical protein